MSIAESDIRINDGVHENRASTENSREAAPAYGERRDGRRRIVPIVSFREPDPLCRSGTMFASAFAAQALVQALALARATPLEASRVYAPPPASRRKSYLFV